MRKFFFMACLLLVMTSPGIAVMAQAELKPAVDFGSLFESVQMEQVLNDSKDFPDSVPKYPPEEVVERYRMMLELFVEKHFELPRIPTETFRSDPEATVEDHIDRLWPVLTRQPDAAHHTSRIPLPHAYIVPGGRFREIYYWDSYFTMLGLQVADRWEMIQNMVDNFAYLIDTIGFIPNGNRTYYGSRSQPPFFSLMVKLLADEAGDAVYPRYLPQMEKEYAFWMDGAGGLDRSKRTHRRVVLMPDGRVLNRYWDDNPSPRPESYRADVMLAAATDRNPRDLYRNIRAAAESGWDFSSRWCADGNTLGSLNTVDIIPVDLNSLIYHLERTLARAYEVAGDAGKQGYYQRCADERAMLINTYCWDAKKGFYADFNFREERSCSVLSLAGMYPLFFEIADRDRAGLTVTRIKRDFLKKGGVVTTLVEGTGQQWDGPNGWAPLQWITITGLRNYGAVKTARRIKERWMALNRSVYKRTGKMMEKYNVVDTALEAGGGEYPGQDGFGWTNGVFLKLASEDN